jgi:hypothetical protein
MTVSQENDSSESKESRHSSWQNASTGNLKVFTNMNL